MDNRTDKFLRKFDDAAKYLGIDSAHRIVSLKYRENVGHTDYETLIDGYLQHDLNLEVQRLKGDFQGNAWLIKDSEHNAVVLVEHETGLEILYIASAIASLVSLIPLISSGWKNLRDRFAGPRFHLDKMTRVEIRSFNSKKQLVEKHVLSVESYVLEESLKEIVVLSARVKQLEKEIAKINKGKKVQEKKLKSPTKKRAK